MSELNEAVKTIIEHKADRIKRNGGYESYVEAVLREHHIIASEAGEETVKVLVKVFRMGAIDGMMYDIGSALAFRTQDDVENWTSRTKRQAMLGEIFIEE